MQHPQPIPTFTNSSRLDRWPFCEFKAILCSKPGDQPFGRRVAAVRLVRGGRSVVLEASFQTNNFEDNLLLTFG